MGYIYVQNFFLIQRGAYTWRVTTLRSTWGNLYVRSFHTPDSSCVQNFFLIQYGSVGVTTVLRLTWGFWEEDFTVPPVTWGYLYGERSHASDNTAELFILEFYLYTYNVGLDSTV